MKRDIVSVTDHIKEFSIERDILGNYFREEIDSHTTIALVWHETINESYLDRFPNIRALVRYGVGYDNIDLDICKKRKISVINTPDYGVDEVSDTAIGMILNLVRKINAFQILAKTEPNYWLGKEINFETRRINTLSLGIVGLGRIGSSIIKKFQSFSRKTSFFDPYIANGIEKVFESKRYYQLDELLQNSDIVSVNTPLTDETFGMINQSFINQMKKGSFLINVSRGPIVENQELILDALKNGQLNGYATDVWETEPPKISDKFINLWKEDDEIFSKVIINPHTAYFSQEALKESRKKACESCLRLINGKNVGNKII